MVKCELTEQRTLSLRNPLRDLLHFLSPEPNQVDSCQLLKVHDSQKNYVLIQEKNHFLFGAISDKSKDLLLVLNSVTIMVVVGGTPKLGCWKSNQSWSSTKQAPYLMYVLSFLPSKNIFTAPFLQGFPCTIRLVTVVAILHTEPQLFNSIQLHLTALNISPIKILCISSLEPCTA